MCRCRAELNHKNNKEERGQKEERVETDILEKMSEEATNRMRKFLHSTQVIGD